jgi:hypothetical protein
MALPLTKGHFQALALDLWCLAPAFNMGFSILPPPATIPTEALASELTSITRPLGNLMEVLPASALWARMTA